ncbi:hypothetical protein K439DRAFT_1640407 [Ramaria rubella]|nr:hypothetical protein K439DRAFT_1640407 [Ramaria rubella]
MSALNINLSIGAVEVGTLISSVLYGVATLQPFSYAGSGLKDPLWLRVMVNAVATVLYAH